MSETADQVDYDLPKISKPKWMYYSLGLFLSAFILYFPLANKIESKLRQSLSSIPGCPINYGSLSFSFFLPKFVVNDLEVPQSCFDKRGAPFTFDNVNLYLRGMSFSPFGPHLKLATNVFGNPFEALISIGFGGAVLNLKDTTVDLAKISPLLPAGLKLDGKAKIDLLLKTGSLGVESLDFKLSSRDLALPSQNIQAFQFSRMNINNILLKAQMGIDGIVQLKEIILGDTESPIRANFKGSIKLSRKVPELSKLDLLGEVAFSEKFLEDYSIVGMLMNRFDKKDDFYQIQIQGPLNRPVPSSPRK